SRLKQSHLARRIGIPRPIRSRRSVFYPQETVLIQDRRQVALPLRVMLQVKPDTAEAFLLRERGFELTRDDHADGFLILLHGLDAWGYTTGLTLRASVDSGQGQEGQQCSNDFFRADIH